MRHVNRIIEFVAQAELVRWTWSSGNFCWSCELSSFRFSALLFRLG